MGAMNDVRVSTGYYESKSESHYHDLSEVKVVKMKQLGVEVRNKIDSKFSRDTR